MIWLDSATAPAPDVGEALVWLVHDAEPVPNWVSAAVLSDSEQARAANIRHPLGHAQFVRGRTILRSALGLRLSIPPVAVPIQLTPDGKPVVEGIHFNMSHTAGFALFGIAGRPIGVDIESADPKRDCDGLMRRYFTPPEQAQYFRLPPPLRPAAFLRGWTCKEALLKAIGSGVRDLQNCRVNLETPEVLDAPEGTWELQAGEVEPGVAWAVCVRTDR